MHTQRCTRLLALSATFVLITSACGIREELGEAIKADVKADVKAEIEKASREAKVDVAKKKTRRPSPKPVAQPMLTEASRTRQCRKELRHTLRQFSDSMGLPYKVDSADSDSLVDKGMVSKAYARDGIQHVTSFRLRAADDGRCKLQFFRKSVSQPGQMESTSANYGTRWLDGCHCK